VANAIARRLPHRNTKSIAHNDRNRTVDSLGTSCAGRYTLRMSKSPPSGFEDQVACFFQTPRTCDERPIFDPWAGTLYLLLREIQDCHVRDIVAPTIELVTREPHALFATTGLVMTGINLLGKFVVLGPLGAPPKLKGEATTALEMRAFVTRYMTTRSGKRWEDIDAETLFRIRNPLAHSFGLHDADPNRPKLLLSLECSTGTAITRGNLGNGSPYWCLCIRELLLAFIEGVERLRDDVISNRPLWERSFSGAFESYGFISVNISERDLC
jgi:hypothetical protein